jgi:hypothetical protein
METRSEMLLRVASGFNDLAGALAIAHNAAGRLAAEFNCHDTQTRHCMVSLSQALTFAFQDAERIHDMVAEHASDEEQKEAATKAGVTI